MRNNYNFVYNAVAYNEFVIFFTKNYDKIINRAFECRWLSVETKNIFGNYVNRYVYKYEDLKIIYYNKINDIFYKNR